MNEAKQRDVPLHRAAAAREDERELASYRRQLVRYPSLTVPQERLLVADLLSSRGDQQETRWRLIEGMLWRAVAFARYYQGRGVALADLIGMANVALVRAAQAFVPAPNRLFRRFAARRLCWALTNHLAAAARHNWGGTGDEDALPLSLDAPLPEDPWTEENDDGTLLGILANSLIYEEAAYDCDWAQLEHQAPGAGLAPPRQAPGARAALPHRRRDEQRPSAHPA